jgi:hypothetical protein
VVQVAGAIAAAGVLKIVAEGHPGFVLGGFASNGFGDLSPVITILFPARLLFSQFRKHILAARNPRRQGDWRGVLLIAQTKKTANHASGHEPAFLPVMAASVLRRSRVDRASRSRRVTISASPLPMWSSARRNPARSDRASVAVSRKTFSAPASRNCFTCAATPHNAVISAQEIATRSPKGAGSVLPAVRLAGCGRLSAKKMLTARPPPWQSHVRDRPSTGPSFQFIQCFHRIYIVWAGWCSQPDAHSEARR